MDKFLFCNIFGLQGDFEGEIIPKVHHNQVKNWHGENLASETLESTTRYEGYEGFGQGQGSVGPFGQKTTTFYSYIYRHFSSYVVTLVTFRAIQKKYINIFPKEKEKKKIKKKTILLVLLGLWT